MAATWLQFQSIPRATERHGGDTEKIERETVERPDLVDDSLSFGRILIQRDRAEIIQRWNRRWKDAFPEGTPEEITNPRRVRDAGQQAKGKKRERVTRGLIVVSESAEKSFLTSDNERLQPVSSFPLFTFASSIFLAPSAPLARSPVRHERPPARKKQLKRLKSPKAGRETKRDGKPSELFAPRPARRPTRPGILRLAVELPRAIAPESNFHSDLLFEQG